MTVDERKRYLGRTKLEEVQGTEVADSLMEMLAPLPWTDVATNADLDRLSSELRGEMALLRGEMAELRAELRGEMAELRGEMRGASSPPVCRELRWHDRHRWARAAAAAHLG